ncbi:MAG: FCD domain-containing protein [Clostridia bacterium]|nr:FCD domain-containing protein [Clostridia bacterium]
MLQAKTEGRLSDYSSGNRAFHSVFYDVCPNRSLAQLIVNLKNQMRKYNSKTVLIPGRTDNGYQEHLAILEAARSGDGETAAKAIVKHIQGVRQIFEDNFDLLF